MSAIKKPMHLAMWTGPGGREVSFHDAPEEFFYKVARAFEIEPHKVFDNANTFAFVINVDDVAVKFFHDVEPKKEE